MMKPINQKPLSKRLRKDLTWAAEDGSRGREFTSHECRAILAALAQTQQLREAAENYAIHDCQKNGRCRECEAFGIAMEQTLERRL